VTWCFVGVLEVGAARIPSMLFWHESPGQRAAAGLGVSFANALLMPDFGARSFGPASLGVRNTARRYSDSGGLCPAGSMLLW